jgi:hypothetical protein
VQKIVRAYERYNQQFGNARQLNLKLSAEEPEEVASPEPEGGASA